MGLRFVFLLNYVFQRMRLVTQVLKLFISRMLLLSTQMHMINYFLKNNRVFFDKIGQLVHQKKYSTTFLMMNQVLNYLIEEIIYLFSYKIFLGLSLLMVVQNQYLDKKQNPPLFHLYKYLLVITYFKDLQSQYILFAIHSD